MNTEPLAGKRSRERVLFDAALELPPGADVGEYLARECPDDEALRARVLALVKSAGMAQDFLPEHWAVSRERPGDVIGRYVLEAEAGRGAFGVVWRVRQTQPVQRTLAMKILKIGLDTRALLARFAAERQALAMMDHPNIARIYDAGETAAGRPFYVMDWLEGVSLKAWMQTCQSAPEIRVRLVLEVAGAVHHAHQKGVIHRDLNPSNIVITMDGERPVPRVIDFGISRMLQPEGGGRTELGMVMGTADYMSPEQRMGKPVDARTDIYALGVILRKVALELAPVAGRSRMAELRWICECACDESPDRRYASAAALGEDLERWLTGRPVVAAPPSPAYRLGRMVSRHRALTAGILLAAGGLVSGLLMALAGREAAEAGRAQAEAGQSHARLEQRRAEKTLRILEHALLSGYAGTGGKWDYTVNQLVEDLARNPPAEATEDPAVEWSLRYSLVNALEGRGQHDLALATVQRLVPLAESMDDAARVALSHSITADTLAVMGRLPDAAGHYQKAMDYHEAQNRRNTEWMLNGIGLGKCALAAGHTEEALARARAVIDTAGSSSLPRAELDSLVARAWGLAANVHKTRGEKPQWIAAAEQRLAVIRSSAEAEESQILDATFYLAQALSHCGEQARALPMAQEVLAARLRRFGPESEPVKDAEELVRELSPVAGE